MYPTSVWDGTTRNRSDANKYAAPNADDWMMIVAELKATQTEVDAVKAGTSDFTNLRVGGFNTGAALTDAIPFTVDLDEYTDGQLDIVAAFGGTSEDLTSAYSAKVGRFRHVILTDTGTVAHETYGLVGQVVVRDTTLTHLHAGLMGTFESHTEAVVLNSAYTYGHAAVIGRVGPGDSITTATTPVCGVLAFYNASALALASGKAIAFGAAANGTTKWDVGVGLEDGCTNALALPAAGTAPVVAAATGAGVAAEGSIAITINGVTKYLQYFAATS